MVQRGRLQPRVADVGAVRHHGDREQRQVGGVGEHGRVQHRVRPDRPGGLEPDPGQRRVRVVVQGAALAGVPGVADVQRGPLPVPLVPRPPGEPGQHVAQLRAVVRRRHRRHRVLVVQAVLGQVERGRHVEDRPAVLAGDHPPGAERTAVAGPLDVVHDRHPGVAGPQEVRVQRVHHPVGVGGARRRDQGLAGHLAAEHPLQRRLGLPPAEQAVVDRLEVEQGQQLVDRGGHGPHRRRPVAWCGDPVRPAAALAGLAPPARGGPGLLRLARSLAAVVVRAQGHDRSAAPRGRGAGPAQPAGRAPGRRRRRPPGGGARAGTSGRRPCWCPHGSGPGPRPGRTASWS